MDVGKRVSQSEPLTVSQLSLLHHKLETSDQLWERCFIGMLLFCVYARSRWSDGQHGEKFIEDRDANNQVAYIEIHTGVHKTARALQLRHQFLPLVAPCVGVVEGNWGDVWIESRKSLPSPDKHLSPTCRPLSATEAGNWMRELLEIKLSSKEIRISSHSLKATMLSYVAKRGCSFEDRLSLGYHTQPIKMALVYSRDGASRPLRVFCHVLMEIRQNIFNPNDTRSGRLAKVSSFDEAFKETLLAEALTPGVAADPEGDGTSVEIDPPVVELEEKWTTMAVNTSRPTVILTQELKPLFVPKFLRKRF